MLKFILLLLPYVSLASDPFSGVDRLVHENIREKIFPGAVAVVGEEDSVLKLGAWGKRDHSELNTLDTIYDLASLTKVVATATSIMILEQQGKLKTTDKLTKWYPEYKASGKSGVTLEHLLRHTSGLPSGIAGVSGENYQTFMKRVLSLPLKSKVGEETVYSDVGFIILGDLVQKVSGMTLEKFTRTYIYGPLGMNRTGYFIPDSLKKLCALTFDDKKCVPHDPKARAQFPNNLGHAGVFSTVSDLSRFARMFIHGGSLNGKTILNAQSIKKMTVISGKEIRGMGWDLLSPYASAPRGDFFPAGISYGHTGFTGTTMWLDPSTKTYYVFLSNRVFLGEDRTSKPFIQFRRDLSTEVGRVIYQSSSTEGTR